MNTMQKTRVRAEKGYHTLYYIIIWFIFANELMVGGCLLSHGFYRPVPETKYTCNVCTHFAATSCPNDWPNDCIVN